MELCRQRIVAVTFETARTPRTCNARRRLDKVRVLRACRASSGAAWWHIPLYAVAADRAALPPPAELLGICRRSDHAASACGPAHGWRWRALLRCQPWGTHGLDFVPKTLPAAARWWTPWRYGRWRGTNERTPGHSSRISNARTARRAIPSAFLKPGGRRLRQSPLVAAPRQGRSHASSRLRPSTARVGCCC